MLLYLPLIILGYVNIKSFVVLFLLNLTLLQSLIPSTTFSHGINGVCWFLSSLFCILCLSPILLKLIQKKLFTSLVLLSILYGFLYEISIRYGGEVFTLFSQGYGKTAIARILNDRGIPNPTEYKRLHDLRYKQPRTQNSTLWKYFAISDMLINEIYIGNMVQGKYGSISYKTKQNKPRPKDQWYRVEGTHEPIIDRELWDNVQALIAQKAKPFTVGQIGLFARKARCMNCGYTLRTNKQRDGRRYLQCPTRHVAKDSCIGSFISVPKLEKAVIDEINKLSAEYLNKDELIENVQFNNNLREQQEEVNMEIVAYQKKISEYTKGIRELYLDKVKGILSETDFLELSKDFSTEKERLEKLVIDSQKKLDVIERKIQAGDNRRQLIEQYTNLEHLDREIVDKLIDYILVGKKDPVTKNVPIEIHWNF